MARKIDLLDEIQHITEDNSKEELFNYLFDYFNTDEIAGFIEHIKEEKGIN